MTSERDSGIEREAGNEDVLPPDEPSSQPPDEQDVGAGIPIPKEVLDQLPPEARRTIVSSFQSRSMQIVAPVADPLYQHITSEHVSEVIKLHENDSVRGHQTATSQRRYQFTYFAVGTAVVVGLLVFFIDSGNRDLITPLLTAVAGFAGGLGTSQIFRR